MEHDRPLTLLHVGCEWLRQEKIVRPDVTRLERVVASAREMAQTETFRRVTPLLTSDVCHNLDAVLVQIHPTGSSGTPQQDLADRAHVSKTTIVGIEAGRIRPHPSTVRKLAAALGLPAREVMTHVRDSEGVAVEPTQTPSERRNACRGGLPGAVASPDRSAALRSSGGCPGTTQTGRSVAKTPTGATEAQRPETIASCSTTRW